MRYRNRKITIEKETNNRIEGIPKYMDIPIHPNDLYIQANDGTRLDIVSQQYYNTPRYWWVLALANKMGKGTLYVTPGFQLRIPHNPEQYSSKIK